MVCFTPDDPYRESRALDETVGSHRYRMSARGSAATYVSLPRQDVLQPLHAGDCMDQLPAIVSLSRTGEGLVNVVSVLFKVADGDASDKSLAGRIHQVMVRRDVVVQLIANLE